MKNMRLKFFTLAAIIPSLALFAQPNPPRGPDYIEQELKGPAMRAIDEEPKDTLTIEELEDAATAEEKSTAGGFCPEDLATSEEESALGSMINEYVELGGAIEVETFWVREFDGVKNSDISLEAAELDFEVTITDWAIGVLAIEWEPDDEVILIKEAFVTFGNPECTPYYFRAGKVFVPFGIGTGAVVGDTLSVSDPLTIEIFETSEDVLMLGYAWNGFYTEAYIFNGDTNSGNGLDDHIEHYGATLRYGIERENFNFSAGIDYISSAFDSDELFDAIPEVENSRYAPAIAFHFQYFNRGFHFLAEYNGTFRSAEFTIIDEETEEEEDFHLAPKAWQIEVGYVTEFCCNTTYFALNYSESYDLDGFFPRRRLLLTAGRWIYEDKILLALEYGRDWDYPTSQNGTGKTADSVIWQIAYEW